MGTRMRPEGSSRGCVRVNQPMREKYSSSAFSMSRLAGSARGQLFKDEFCQPVEGKNLQPREAGNFRVGEQLAFELERGLLGRKQNQRRAVGRGAQGGTDLGETSERLAAAGGAEEKARLHGGKFHAKAQRRKGIYLPADHNGRILILPPIWRQWRSADLRSGAFPGDSQYLPGWRPALRGQCQDAPPPAMPLKIYACNINEGIKVGGPART